VPSGIDFDGKEQAVAVASKFTLRFERERTHALLRMVAEHFGMSMNALAEDMISRELRTIGLAMEQDLYGTLELLRRSYGSEDIDAGLAAFAKAEIEQLDPMQARMIDQVHDALGVEEAFA
jgi:hypothetical protein